MRETAERTGRKQGNLSRAFKQYGLPVRMRGGGLHQARHDWQRVILPRAVEIVGEYDTPVTLRQVFYRLVSEGLVENTRQAYNGLSNASSQWRREGRFPDLLDTTREIERPSDWVSPEFALRYLGKNYRIDRTRGQAENVYLMCEKRTMAAQLRMWFGDERSIPVVCLGGFASQTFVKDIADDIIADERQAVVLYAGDFDPSGESIIRDFLARIEQAGGDHEFEHVALTAEQVAEYGLPEMMGKESDPRAAGFTAKYGRLVQVELDALDPDDLRRLFADAIEPYWDAATFEAVIAREAEEREKLATLAE